MSRVFLLVKYRNLWNIKKIYLERIYLFFSFCSSKSTKTYRDLLSLKNLIDPHEFRSAPKKLLKSNKCYIRPPELNLIIFLKEYFKEIQTCGQKHTFALKDQRFTHNIRDLLFRFSFSFFFQRYLSAAIFPNKIIN